MSNEDDPYQGRRHYHEHTFRSLVEHSGEGIAIMAADGNPLYTSPSVERMLGYTREELFELGTFPLIHPDDHEALAEVLGRVLANPGVPIKGHTGRMLHKDGTWRWVEAIVTNLLDDPAIAGIVNNFRDITDRKAADEKVQHMTRLYAFISQINQVIVRVTNEEDLFKEVCRIAIEFGKFKAAWIGIYDPVNETTDLVEQAGMYPEDVAHYKNVYYTKGAPQYHVFTTGGHSIFNNVQEELPLKSWRAFAEHRGYRSAMALPIKIQDRVIGSFNVYAGEIDFFNEQEIALLTEAAGDISYALHGFEKKKLKEQAEEKLAHSNSRLRLAQSIAKIGSWETDLLTMNVKWSDETYSIFETDTDGFTGTHRAFVAFVVPAERAMVEAAFERAKYTSETNKLEHRIVTGAGQEKWVEENWQVYFDEHGMAVKAFGTCQDISERKSLEAKLRESENVSLAILSALPLHIAIIDRSGIILLVNKAWNDFARENGVVFMELTSKGSNYFDACEKAIIGGDDIAKQAVAGIRSVFNKETEVFELEYPCHSPTEERWFVLQAVLFGEDETKVVCNHLNVTDRTKAERDVRRYESNLHAIMENTDAAIYSLDRNLCYITFNKSMVTGLKTAYGLEIKAGDQVYGFLEKIDPVEAREWERIYAIALSGEQVKFEKEFTIGEYYSCLSFSIYPIWENDEVTGLACFASDITKQKQTTIQIQKMLVDIVQRNKNLEQFTYIVSHNLRAPIANIKGLTELLAIENCSNEERTMVDGIARSVNKLDGVVHDLDHILQVRHEVNKHKVMVDLSGLLSEIKLAIHSLLRNEEVELVADLSAVNEILSLKSYLYSIFFNLISNSIKFRRPGIPPVINISSRKREGEVVLIFSDNGLGIDLVKNAGNMFGLYKQFHQHTEGKGMGLYVVKTQVEALGGTIEVVSEVNKGSTFTIVFKTA